MRRQRPLLCRSFLVLCCALHLGAAAAASDDSPKREAKVELIAARDRAAKETAASPGSARAWGRLAVLRDTLGDAKGGDQAMKRSLALNPNDSASAHLRCTRNFALRRWDAAIAECRRSIDHGEPEFLNELLLSRIYFARRHFNQARIWGEKAVQRFPDSPQCVVGLSRALVASNQREDALKVLREGRTRMPKELRLSLESGSILYASGKFEAAIEDLRSGIAASPRDPARAQAEHMLGNLLRELERPAESVPHFEQAVRRLPREADYQLGLAYAYSESGDNKNADARFDLVSELRPAASEYKGIAALSALYAGDPEKASRLAEEFVTRYPKDGVGYYARAKVLELRGQVDDSAREYSMALALKPRDEHIWADSVMMLAEAGRQDDARRKARIFLRELPDSAIARNIQGLLFLKERDLRNAEKWFMRTFELERNHPTAQYNMGCVQALRGDAAGALGWLEKSFPQRRDYAAHAMQDADLASLRKNRAFRDLVARYEPKGTRTPTAGTGTRSN